MSLCIDYVVHASQNQNGYQSCQPQKSIMLRAFFSKQAFKKKVCMTNQFSIFQSLVCFNISLVITQASGLDIAQQNGRPVLGFKFCQ